MRTCSFYLVSPIGLATGALSLNDAASLLCDAIEAPGVAAFLLKSGGSEATPADAGLIAQIERLRPLLHAAGIPLLLEERADLVQSHGCDGVHVEGQKRRVAAVRRALGEDAIVGAGAAASRHQAMEAGEAGANYIAFGNCDPEPQPPNPELLSWWQEVIELPCVAMDNALEMAEAGADFLALRQAVWNHEGGPRAALQAFAQRIAESEDRVTE